MRTYEYALKKAQRFESNKDCYTLTVDQQIEESQRIEEKFKMMQKTIQDLSLRNAYIWYILYMNKWQTKDTCQHRDEIIQEV
jgi:hypothetical protein